MSLKKRLSLDTAKKLAPRVSSLADQAFLSAVSFIQTAAYVRHLSTDDFGVFSLFYYTIVLATSVQRASSVMPMTVSTRHEGLGEIRTWNRVATASSLAMAALFALAWGAQVVIGVGFGHFPLLYCALGVLPFLAFEFHRRSLFLQRRPFAAACCSATFFVLQCVGTALALWFKLSLPAVIAIYIANSLLASLMARLLSLRGVPPAPETALSAVTGHRSLILWNLASLAPYMVYNNAMPLIIGMVFGLRDAAIYSATRILMAPITMLVQAVDSTDKPRAARALQTNGVKGLLGSLRRTGITLAVLAAPYLAVLLLFPHHILRVAIGETYAAHTELVPYWVALSVIFLAGQPLESGLVVLKRSDLYFWSRTVAAGLTVTLLFLGRQASNGALAGVQSTTLAWGISTALALFILVRVAKRRPISKA